MATSNPINKSEVNSSKKITNLASTNSNNLEKILNASLEKQNKLTAESPLSISENNVISADVYDKAYIDEKIDGLEKSVEGGITDVTASGSDPLTLSAKVTDNVATITGSVDLSNYATNETVEEKQDKLSAGIGISIDDDNVISVILDTTLYKVVTELPNYPDYDDTNKIFLVPEDNETEGNMFIEYIWVSENWDWEKIGEVRAEVDLSDYVTNEEFSETLESYATIEYVDNNINELNEEISKKQDKGTVYKTDSIENLPTTYDFIIVDLEASGTLTFESIPESGKKIDVYVKNVENGIEILSFPDEYEIMGSSHQSLVEYGVSGTLLHVFSDGEKVYINIEGSVELPEPGTDILFYDKITDEFVEVSKDKWNINDYAVNRYDPIGLIVIPREHDVYGTGECGILSLDYMSCETPETGTDDLDCIMYFGLSGIDTSDSYNDCLPACGTVSDPTDTVTSYNKYTSDVGASDNFSGKQHPMNMNLFFHDAEGTDSVTPPPFDSDGNKIDDYSGYVENNGFGDFNGKENTANLISYVTGQPNWKTDSTITDSSDAEYCPPACCCQRYHVDHTSAGDWYLPALGELGYVLAQIKAINNTIIDLDAEYGKGWATITTVKQHWSSTLLNSDRVRTILMRNGGINRIMKDVNHHARAMMRF